MGTREHSMGDREDKPQQLDSKDASKKSHKRSLSERDRSRHKKESKHEGSAADGMDKAAKYRKLYSIKSKEFDKQKEAHDNEVTKGSLLVKANVALREEVANLRRSLQDKEKQLLDKSTQEAALRGKLLTMSREMSTSRNQMIGSEGDMKKNMMTQLSDPKEENKALKGRLEHEEKTRVKFEDKTAELEIKLGAKQGDS